jgi:hypothetical protein
LTDIEADGSGGGLWRILLLVLTLIVGIVLLLFLVGLALLWWVEYRGLGGLSTVQKTYARLGIYGHWLGANLNNRLTPDERRRRLIHEAPDGRQPINAITHLYIRDRFAPPVPEDTQREAEHVAGTAWTKARAAFIMEKIRRWLGRR